MPTRLLDSKDLALILGVSQPAISNWRKRNSGPAIPEADFTTRDGRELWLPDTLAPLIAERVAELNELTA